MAKMVYFAYGVEIYGNTYKKYLNKLMILNNKILRLLQKLLSIHVYHSYIQISIQCLYLNSISFKFWNLYINLFINKISYLLFILISLTKIVYVILITHVLKMLSIPSLSKVLLGKDLSHIKVLSFGTLSLKI